MHLGLVLLPLMFTFAHTLYYEWPMERQALENLPEQELDVGAHDVQLEKTSGLTLVRERRAKRLCGQKFIEHLLVLCNSCILPAGSEIVKRSLIDETARETVQRLMKRELSIAKKCCAGQCKMSELEALCCKTG